MRTGVTVFVAIVMSYSIASIARATPIYSFEFSTPDVEGVDLDNDGNIYVTSRASRLVRKFDALGNLISEWGGFTEPYGLVVDPEEGWVYVADNPAHRIRKFDTNGNFLLQWGGLSGRVLGIAVDNAGFVYSAQWDVSPAVHKFNSSGVVQQSFSGFNMPWSLTVDNNGNLYVADTFNRRVVKLDPSGNVLMTIHGFLTTFDVAVDSSGSIYVLDGAHNHIVIYNSAGEHLETFGGTGSGPGQFYNAHQLTIKDDFLFVADTYNDRVQVFELPEPTSLIMLAAGSIVLFKRRHVA